MAARHFLCCLPLRLGTLLISLVQLALFGLIAGGSWYVTSLRGNFPAYLKWAIIANGIYYSILALAALFGLFGTIVRNAGLLSTYAFALGWSIVVQIVIDVVYMVGIFSQSRQTLIDHCIDGSTDQEVKDMCNNFFSGGKWALLTGLIIGLIIQLWAARIVSGYAQKLNDERTWRSGPGVTVTANVGPRYTHLNQDDHEHHIPLTSAPYVYPYSNTNNSFGHATHHHNPSAV